MKREVKRKSAMSVKHEEWKGFIVENGLLDLGILDYVTVLDTRNKELGVSDIWLVHDVVFFNENLKKVISILTRGLRPGWYASFVKDDRRLVIFKGKSFDIERGSERSLAEVKNWAFKKYNLLPGLFTLEV